MSDPIDLALASNEKLSSVGGLPLSKAHLVSAAAGAAAAGAAIGVQRLMAASRKASSYRDMLELNPDLKEHQKQDPRRFQAHYDSLRRLAPAFGEDPVVAGALMRRMSASPESAGSILQQVVRQPELPRGSSPLSIETGFGPFKLKHNV